MGGVLIFFSSSGQSYPKIEVSFPINIKGSEKCITCLQIKFGITVIVIIPVLSAIRDVDRI